MPTRFCLKNMGDPSSMNMAKAKTIKSGNNNTSTNKAIKRFTMIYKDLYGSKKNYPRLTVKRQPNVYYLRDKVK